MAPEAEFSYESPLDLDPPNPDQRDRQASTYIMHRDTVLRPDARKRGIQVPLIAFWRKGRRQVTDGGTRLDVAILERISKVPVLTYPEALTPQDLRNATFLANENRLDWTPAERGRFYLDSMRENSWSQAEMCRQIPGLGAARVCKTLKWLDKLIEQFKAKVGEGDGFIPERSAYRLCDWPAERQEELGKKIMDGLMTVEALENLHAKEFGKKPPKAKTVKVKLPGLVLMISVAEAAALLALLGQLDAALKQAQKLKLPLTCLPQLLR
jgi:hypothetical protein